MITLESILMELKSSFEYYIKTIPGIFKNYNKVVRQNKVKFIYADLCANPISDKKLLKRKINNFLKMPINKNEKVSDYLQWNGSEFISIKENDIFDKRDALMKKTYTVKQLEIAIKSPIIDYITTYEKFLRMLIEENPDYFSTVMDKETITYLDIKTLNCDSQKIDKFIVERYCFEKLRGENKRLENVIKTLSLGSNGFDDLIDEFNEVYYRRNIYVHSLRGISQDYKTLPKSITSKWIKNGELEFSIEYVKHAYYVVCCVIILLAIKFHIIKENDQDFIKYNMREMSRISFDNYYKKNVWPIAEFCYKELKRLPNDRITKTDRYFYFINYMVCLKAQKKDDEFKKELSKWSCETDATIFQIAQKALTENYKNINNLIKEIYIKDESLITEDMEDSGNFIVLDYLKEWPVFRWYRKSEEYKELINELEQANN